MPTYCERCGPGLFDEPINVASNVVFLLAAFLAWYAAPRRDAADGGGVRAASPGLWVLVALSVSVGLGSATWHTFATRWALALDVVPIMLFQLAFLWLYGREVVGLRPPAAAAVLAGYLGAGLWLREYRGWLNGLIIYAPTLLLSWAVGFHWWRAGRRERYLLLISAGVFCLSLACRTLDLVACRRLPIGTHFLWHVLNGWVLYAAMRAVALAQVAGAASGAGSAPRGVPEPVLLAFPGGQARRAVRSGASGRSAA